jgi:hypothetical protein
MYLGLACVTFVAGAFWVWWAIQTHENGYLIACVALYPLVALGWLRMFRRNRRRAQARQSDSHGSAATRLARAAQSPPSEVHAPSRESQADRDDEDDGRRDCPTNGVSGPTKEDVDRSPVDGPEI